MLFQGIRLDSVSMGKGFVEWHVHYPPVAKKIRELKGRYDDLNEACADLKRYCLKEEVNGETVRLVEEQCPDISWGSERKESLA